jgi:hypothetical protein
MLRSLQILPHRFAVSQLPPDSPIPAWVGGVDFYAIIHTDQELSIVCLESQVPEGVRSERHWRILRVLGTLDFSLVGILAGITHVLAGAGVSIFAISTFDTDYILLKQDQLGIALEALHQAGYQIQDQM